MQLSTRIQTILKVSIAVVAVAFIVWKLTKFENLADAWDLFKMQIGNSSSLWFFAALIGMPVNFFFEIFKWNMLIRLCHPLSFNKATLAVLSGLTMAMLTPNRVGEIFSRVFVLPSELRQKGIGYSGLNSLSQMIIVQLFGLSGMGYLLWMTSFGDSNSHPLTSWLIAVSIVISILLILVFMNLSWINYLIRVVRLDKNLPGISQAFSSMRNKDKWQSLVLSAAKFLTFNLQFYFLLRYFGVEISAGIALPAIMTIFLLLNFLPVIAIGEAGVRGSVSLLILGIFSDSELAILVSSLALWVLNVALPAIAGGFLLRKIKF